MARRKLGVGNRAIQITWHSLLWSAVGMSPGPAWGQLTINEIEYDQSGAPDTRDFIELYEPGQTGISLAGWQFILYDGTANKRRPYLTIELNTAPGGVMPSDGYLVIGPVGVVPNVDIASPSGGWIQNGPPDGMALVRDGVVVELLAYEGTFDGNTNGTGGPAAGMNFPNIGLMEDSGDENGLQKMPDGGNWTLIPESAATPGGPNPSYWGVMAYGKLVLMHTNEDESGAITLCADGGTPPYTFTITALPANGVLGHAGGPITTVPTAVSGDLLYVPNWGFSGLDAFTFTARDGVGWVSPPATQEIAVQGQIQGVVISEVMPLPSGSPQVYEYVEIYNATPSVVNLGRLDASPPLSSNTVGNLLGRSIPPGAARIMAPDPREQGYSLDLFRCEWGLQETEIVRIPLANWEFMFSAPASTCSASDGSRLLLFDAAGNLLDAVDLRHPGLPAATAGHSLTVNDQLLTPPGGPLDTDNNDLPTPWVYAGGTGVPGVRASLCGDLGGPMVVPTLSPGPYTPEVCAGRCCLPGNGCEVQTYADCGLLGGDLSVWEPNAGCGVDLSEFQSLQSCLAGPGATPPAGCSESDSDADGDVDLRDFAAFQITFTVPPCP